MSRAKLPVVAAGTDWAPVLGGRLGRRPGDLSHHAVEVTRNRLRLALVCFVIVFSVLAGRLTQLTILQGKPAWHSSAQKQNAAARPAIIDRNGVVLATQISTITLGADAKKIADGEAMAQRLKAVLPELNTTRAARLMNGTARHVPLQTGLTPAQKQAILELGEPALKLTRDSSRVYPTGAVMAHSVGFTSNDMRGLLGLERTLDNLLSDDMIEGAMQTSLDVRVQHAVRDALLEAGEKFSTKAAGAIIVDVHNGEIIALVSLPDFDANAPMANGQAAHFNRMTLGVYELGSIFKVFTAAMVLDSGAVSTDELFSVTEALKISGHEIDDTHQQDKPLTVKDILIHSSNIGSAQLALRMPQAQHYEFLHRLGFATPVPVDLPERASPLLPGRWTDIERATSSYGHGISVSPLHALMAGAALVNGGVLYEPSLQKVGLPVGQRIISAETSQAMRDMMRAVVVSGTGRQAEVPGYQVLGKTGSAEKPVVGGYSTDKLVTSFLGAFPADAPRYALLVMLDEPQGIDATFGYYLAGWNAAPTAADIIRRTAPLLGVMPRFDVPTEQAALPDAPDRQMGGEVAYAP